MRKPVVWIVKEQVRRLPSGVEAMDYTGAMKYGELRFITDFDPPTHIHRSSVLEGWGKAVKAFIKEFDPTTDFIIASGQPTAMMMISYLLGLEVQNFYKGTHMPPRFLLWRREEGTYIPYDPLSTLIKE